MCGYFSQSGTWTASIPQPPTIPTLTSPANGSSTTDSTPDFDWGDVAGATQYQIQVDDNSNFTSPEIDTTTTSSSHTPTTSLVNGTYYWHVRANNGVWNDYSGSWTVIVAAPPAVPSLTSPSNGSSTADSTPDFDWGDVAGVTQYQVQVDDNSNFTSPEIDTTTALSAYMPTTSLANGIYYWHVRAGNGVWSAYSGSWTVIVAVPPAITGFSPTSGPVGTSVTLTGMNFTGATAVKFNGTSASFSVASATSINATVPADATTGPISVTTPGGTATSASSFTVIPAPTITSFSPTNGLTGTSVTITGTNFTGAAAVKFNGTSASFSVISATSINATVPAGVTSGPISVTTPGGTATSAANFAACANPFTVQNTDDSGSGSLRQAIATGVCNGGVINFAPSLTGTITLGSELVINKDLTISGPGASIITVSGNHAVTVFNVTSGSLSINNLTIANGRGTSSFASAIHAHGGPGTSLTLNNVVVSGSGDVNSPVYVWGSRLVVNNSTFSNNTCSCSGGAIYLDASLDGLSSISGSTFTNNSIGGGVGNDGGAILNFNSVLTINNSSFTGNHAVNGGAIATGYAGGLTVNNSVFANNSATNGGAIHNAASIPTTINNNSTFSGNNASINGGGIYNAGTLTLENSTVSDNTANVHGGGIYNYNSDSTLTLNNSIIGDNSSGQDGGAIYNFGVLNITDSTLSGNISSSPNGGGGAIYSYGTVALTRSAISDNHATGASGYGGGILNGGPAILTVSNSTFSGNSTTQDGGGVINWGQATFTNSAISGNSASSGSGGLIGWPITLKNTILANNTGGNCAGTIIDSGNNLQYPGTDCGGTIPTADPLLGSLADNGGPTLTMALLPGSPAIDAGDNAICAAAPINNLDQRGGLRPVDGDHNSSAICDIGAYEYGGIPVISGNAGVAGATLSYIDGSSKTVTTDGTGAYSLRVSFGWTGTITPAKAGYAFQPPFLTISTPVTADLPSQNFSALSTNADLSNLVFSTGALTPVFATGTITYTQSVANTVTSLTVTPTVADATATVKVNGTTVASGSASGVIALVVGPNTITTVVTAQDGTTTKTYTVTVTRAADAIAPTVNTFTVTTPTNSLNIPITAFTASDAGGVTGYTITTSATAPLEGATDWIATAPTTYSVASDGSYTLYPWAKDATGNVSDVFVSPRPVVVDTTAPIITITNPDTSPSQSKTVTASASDGTLTMSNTTGSTCDDSLTFVAYASQTFTSEADNGKKVCYKAVDAAGNSAYSLSNTIAGIDTTSPIITITNPDTSPSQSKTVTASASDGILTMSNTTGSTCDDSLTFVAYASQAFTSEADNGKKVCYKAVDVAGNTAYNLSNAIAGIDTTAPTIIITNPDTSPALNKTITASASDGTLTMINTSGSTCDSSLSFIAYASQTFTSEADNGQKVCYKAIDALGNSAYSLSNAIAGIDTTAPSITISNPDTSLAQSKTITASASDGTLTMSNTTSSTCDGSLTFVAYASQTFTSEADNGKKVCYKAVDAAGNSAYSLSNAIAGIDTTAPTVVLNTIGNPNPASTASVDFIVVFSETVVDVAADDFSLTKTGTISGESVTSVSGGPKIYIVSVNTGTGNGDLRLDIPGSATVTDQVGNLLAGLPYISGELYSIDKAAPTVISSLCVSANPTSAASVDFVITFSESVLGVDATDFSLTTTGLVGASVTNVSNFGDIRNVTVNTGMGSGTLRLDMINDGSIVDAASNPLSGGFTSGQSYDVQKTWNVAVTIGGAPQGYYNLAAGQSTRASYTVNNGPVKVQSSGGVLNIASERVAYNNGTDWTSYSELMGLPKTQLTDTYYFPWYNNLDLNTQVRFANVGSVGTTVTITIGGVVQGLYPLAPGVSTRQSYAVNNGPVQVKSSGGVPIIASERVAYNDGSAWTSYSEIMGLPKTQLTDTYYFAWYNNLDLNTQVRFANVGTVPTTVTITIGGVEQGSYYLAPGVSTRQSYAVNNGPMVVKSSGGVPILASERVAYKNGSAWTDFSEMMGLPKTQLTDTYLLPWYNNIDLNTQVRFANVGTVATTVTVTIGGVVQGSYYLAPGVSTRASYSVNNGPIQIKSSGGVPIIASERVAYNNGTAWTSFSELMGLPKNLVTDTYYFPWYNNLDLNTQMRFGVP